MLKLDSKWGETSESLLQQTIQAENKRLRERFLALALIASGQSTRQVAKQLQRRRQTICEWVHHFNHKGPRGLIPNFQSPSKPRLTSEEFEQLKQAIEQPPRQSGMKVGRWSGPRVAAYIKKEFGKQVSADTAWRYLHRLGFSLKRPRKKFRKADEKAQRKFAKKLEALERSRWGHSVTVWIDEGHIYQDALLRWMWCQRGQEALVESNSPGKKKLSFYVAVVRPLGQIISLQVKTFNGESTARFLRKIRAKSSGYRIDGIFDQASHHKGDAVREALEQTRIHRHFLPSYSPKMNAAEQWIRWVKEALSYNICWENLSSLILSFNGFVVSMAQQASKVLQRCVPELFGFSCV